MNLMSANTTSSTDSVVENELIIFSWRSKRLSICSERLS